VLLQLLLRMPVARVRVVMSQDGGPPLQPDAHQLYRSGDFKGAAELCEQSLLQDPSNLSTLLLVSACHFMLRDFDRRYEATVAISPPLSWRRHRFNC